MLARADTLDMYILDVGTRWVKYQRELEEGQAPTTNRRQPTQEELLAMVEKAKQKQGANNA